jgi:ubiquinone/menaquinone biosynthesis C-methylase UbiE
MEPYYERRAPEYDEWYLGTGLFAERDRPGWDADVRSLSEAIAALPPVRTLDVAAGTGFLTRHLTGHVIALDASAAMLAESRRRHGHPLVRADAFSLPFADGSLDRVFTAHFYGHLWEEQRTRFQAEARRVAAELVIVDAAIHPAVQAEQVQERRLNDGSRHRIYKRYFTAEQLADELGDGRVLFEGRWFLAVASARP